MATTNGNGTRGATIVGLTVKDFQGLRAAELQHLPGQGLVRVTGRNGAGKSSLLKSIEGALGGAARVHERVVNDAAEDGEAYVELVLSNGYRIVRKTTPAAPKGYLTVVGPDGGKHNQSKLDELVGPLSFDPLAFFGLPRDRQTEILLSLGTDPELGQKLDRIREQEASLREQRRPINSEIQRIQRMKEPEGERPEPVDVSGEMQRLGRLQAAERDRQDQERAVQRAEAAVEQADADLQEAKAEVERLRRLLAEAEKRVESWGGERAQGEHALKEAREELAAMPDPSDEIQAVQARISEADSVNARLEPWKEWDRAQARLEEAKREAEAFTLQIDALKDRERAYIADAGIPVEGIAFDEDGEVTLNGRPLELASGGERIRLSTQVALAAGPGVSIALIDEANDLDPEGLEQLHQEAVEHGFQVWVCRIGLEGPGDVVVQDGHATTAGEPEAATATEPVPALDLEL